MPNRAHDGLPQHGSTRDGADREGRIRFGQCCQEGTLSFVRDKDGAKLLRIHQGEDQRPLPG